MDSICGGLSYVLEPLTLENFVSNYCGHQFTVLHGPPDKYAHIFTWEDLNHILDYHQFIGPQLRVTRENRTISPDVFMRAGGNRPLVHNLSACLRGGGRLFIEKADDLHERVRSLAKKIEQELNAGVSIDIIAEFGQRYCQDGDCEPYERIILQLVGRSLLNISDKVKPLPLAGDTITIPPTPPTPLWEGAANGGDAVYVPRGYVYASRPLEQAVLQLSIRFTLPTGYDALEWVVGDIKCNEVIRQNVPLSKNGESRQEFITRLQRAALEAMQGESLIERFLQQSSPPTRRSFSLPFSAGVGIASSPETAYIEAMGRNEIGYSLSKSGTILIAECTKENTLCFDPAAGPLLDYINSHMPVRLSEFLHAFDDTFDRSHLLEFLQYLTESELVVLRTNGDFQKRPADAQRSDDGLSNRYQRHDTSI